MKNDIRSMLQLSMSLIVPIAMGLGLQSMRPAPAVAEAEEKPGRSVHISWPDLPVDCDLSLNVTYVEAIDADCSSLYQICRFTDCFNISAGTPDVFIPGAGTILQVDVHCGSDCSGPSTTAFVCDAVCIRSTLECCGILFRVSGGGGGPDDVWVVMAD